MSLWEDEKENFLQQAHAELDISGEDGEVSACYEGVTSSSSPLPLLEQLPGYFHEGNNFLQVMTQEWSILPKVFLHSLEKSPLSRKMATFLSQV